MPDPDLTYAGLKTALGDNNIGAITEEDIRSVVEYVRPHAVTVGVDSFDSADATTDYVTTTNWLAPLLGNGLGEVKHQYKVGAEDALWVDVNNNGIQYSASATVARLFQISFQMVGFNPSTFAGQMGFYVVDSGSTFPTDTTRYRNSYLNKLDTGDAVPPASGLYRYETQGSFLVELSPGETLTPTLEVNDDTTAAGGLTGFRFVIDAVSVGAVTGDFTAFSSVDGSGEVDFLSDEAGANGVARDISIPT